MTSLITDVLTERAERAGSPDLDLDRLIAEGEARARRTRVTRVAGATGVGLLAAATVGAVVLAGLGGSPGRSSDAPDVADGPSTAPGTQVPLSRMLSYAHDGTIVVPQADIELRTGRPVRSYVPTDDGFVWMAPDGTISFLPASGGQGGPGIEIGETDPEGGALRAEKDGTLVAWIDFSVPGGPELVVHDTATLTEVLRTGEDLSAGSDPYRDDVDPAFVHAVDRGSVYWLNAAGAVRTDVATGRTEVLDPDAGGFTLWDVAAGQIASNPATPVDDARSQDVTRVGPSLTEGTDLPWTGNVHLSPDARSVSFEDADALVVADVATGREVGPTNPGYDYWVVTQWVGSDTVAAFGIRDVAALDDPEGPDTAPLDFLVCEIPDGTCTVVAEDEVDLDSFALPVGETS